MNRSTDVILFPIEWPSHVTILKPCQLLQFIQYVICFGSKVSIKFSCIDINKACHVRNVRFLVLDSVTKSAPLLNRKYSIIPGVGSGKSYNENHSNFIKYQYTQWRCRFKWRSTWTSSYISNDMLKGFLVRQSAHS